MEYCIEARALKSSFYMSQMDMKTTNTTTGTQMFCNEDVWCFSGINGTGSEDFPVEDLLNLDFPDKDDFLLESYDEEDDEKSRKRDNHSNNSSSSNLSSVDDFDSLDAGELAVPVDDLENLEWLSRFVDDSTPGLSLLCPTGTFAGKPVSNSGQKRVEPVKRPVQKTRPPCFTLPVPSKARSKRSNLNKRPWSLTSPPLTGVDSSSTTSSYSSVLSPFAFMSPIYDSDWFSSVEKPLPKKNKRKPEGEPGLITGRRCTHCQVQKTPQWRTGPLGPKTLCNACGVRFKSGRLYPEYRPACSPTFSLEVHSNSHRKVLEMRRKKETSDGIIEPGLVRVVSSF